MKYRQLTQEQRCIIQHFFELGKSRREIAAEVGCHHSTIVRELNRNRNTHGQYKALGAHGFARDRRISIYDCRRKIEGTLQEQIKQLLEMGLSPQQASFRLKLERRKFVSHETIYRWIYALEPGFIGCLRRQKNRRHRAQKKASRKLSYWPKRAIEQRPKSADERSELGHWERDTLMGRRGQSSLLVSIDRASRFCIARKIESQECSLVNRATRDSLAGQIVRSITNDNGIEFGRPKELEKLVDAKVFHCRPYASWERGSVENLNGLLRQVFPKRVDFRKVSDERLQEIVGLINLRPRKIFGYRSAAEIHSGRFLPLTRSDDQLKRDAQSRSLRDEIAFWKDFARGALRV